MQLCMVLINMMHVLNFHECIHIADENFELAQNQMTFK